MGISVILQPQPHHNPILVRIHEKDLSADTHSVVSGIVCFVGPNTTGVVPAEVVALIVCRISRRLLNPGFAHNPLSVPYALIQSSPNPTWSRPTRRRRGVRDASCYHMRGKPGIPSPEVSIPFLPGSRRIYGP